MATSSLLALIDDIALLLDDVALMTKVAAQKTAGVLGDDLALNAQQVAGVRAERELPVVWAVARGSMVNKAILVPLALLISTWAPWAVTPLLMLGGAYLCFEGCEKLAHKWLADGAADARHQAELARALGDASIDVVAFERDKIKGAVRTDFILSAEIITITLGTVAAAPQPQQVLVMVGIALAMTVGVYGLVAGIVKLDDAGLWLTRRASAAARWLGAGMVRAAPALMRALSVAGTAAMFLVGGGIVVHGWPMLNHAVERAGQAMAAALGAGADGSAGLLHVVVATAWPWLANALVGLAVGTLALLAWTALQRLRGLARPRPKP